MAPITPIHFAQGLITLIFASMSALLGAVMIRKYFKYKEKQLLYAGIAWTSLSTLWWGDTNQFFYMLFCGDECWLYDPVYFFFSFALFFPILIFWPRVYGDLMLGERKYLRQSFIWIATIWGIFFEIILIRYIFVDVYVIGTRIGPFSVEGSWIMHLLIFVGVTIFVITGLIFAHDAAISNIPEIKKKGEILFFAFIELIVALILEALFAEFDTILLIARIINISAAFNFYIGFMLPKFVKKIFKLE